MADGSSECLRVLRDENTKSRKTPNPPTPKASAWQAPPTCRAGAKAKEERPTPKSACIVSGLRCDWNKQSELNSVTSDQRKTESSNRRKQRKQRSALRLRLFRCLLLKRSATNSISSEPGTDRRWKMGIRSAFGFCVTTIPTDAFAAMRCSAKPGNARRVQREGKCAKKSSTIFQVWSGWSSHGMWPHLSMNASVEFLISECASQTFASPARSCRP
jgi:hypothetical protein